MLNGITDVRCIVRSSMVALALLSFSLPASNQPVWTAISPAPTSEILQGITFGNGQFVAVGANGIILTSTDAVTWTTRSSGTMEMLYSICAKSNLFVVVGETGTILTSPDGATWTQQTSPTTSGLHGIEWNGTVFVAAGVGSTVLTSPDGSTWTNRTFPTPTEINGIAWGNSLSTGQPGQFVAVGFNGSSGTIDTSSNGIDWALDTTIGSEGLFAITWCDTMYLAGSNPMFASHTRAAWTPVYSGMSSYIFGLTFHANQIIAVGGQGTLLSSTDGINWTAATSDISATLTSVTWGNGTFVAVGAQGTIATSPTTNSIATRSAVSKRKNGLTVSNGSALFSLSTDAVVTLQLYSMQGKLVKTPATTRMSSGTHRIDISKGLPVGSYILSFITNNREIRQSVVIVR